MLLTAQRNAVLSGRVAARCGPMLPSRPAARSSVIRRFKEDGKPENVTEELQQDLAAAAAQGNRHGQKATDTKLTKEQLEEIYNKEPGNFNPRTAEMRADLGTAATDLSQYQTFDGPIPETVNGRLAMLGVVSGLYVELMTGKGLAEQGAEHPLRILFIAALFIGASYAPVIKGYTRKEPFANLFGGLPWTPTIENWNGRLAMLGFTGMILTEAITGVNTLQAWGLQPLHWVPPVL